MKQNVKCPYESSGICYRKGCIYIPNLDCMNTHELNNRMKYAKKGKKRKWMSKD